MIGQQVASRVGAVVHPLAGGADGAQAQEVEQGLAVVVEALADRIVGRARGR
ncbi:hypothetical protein ACFQFH_15435 [Halobaculum halobium]|uniref:hypothetical protein n=1 Tax=Halobaculum halobium TaxID=3032281 RepID=UPI003609BBA7